MPPRGAAPGTLTHRIVCAIALLGWAALFVQIWNPRGAQWDFRSYYTACHVYEDGGDPYDVKAIRAKGGSEHLLPYYYPLAALHLIQPVCDLDYVTAHRLWLLLKAMALAALLLLWKRQFLEATPWSWLLMVTLLGFGGAAVWDAKGGNVATFEQLFLWSGFAFLLASRVSAFVACVVVASVFKITPAAFLLLLLLPGLRSRANVVRMAAGFAAVAALALVPFIGHGQLIGGFVRGLWKAHTGLQFNPTFFGSLSELAVKYKHAVFGGPLKYVLLAVYTALVLLLSRRLLRSAATSGSLRYSIYVAVLLYALLMPRFVIYSYMIVLVPVLALVIPVLAKSNLAAAGGLVALCVSGIPVYPTKAGEFLGNWTPFLLLAGCWGVLLAAERAGGLEHARTVTGANQARG